MSRLLLVRAGTSCSLSYTSFLTGDGLSRRGSFDTHVCLPLCLTPRIAAEDVDDLLLRGAYARRGIRDARPLDAAGHSVAILSLSPPLLFRLAR
ncbi:hypothetical protein B0H14DRAFT_2856491 [Mycena olivaceomarginata]|nr:hypothetical protein B0H14DRAFT_2856491 [Mycena olivaceomarginata]